jgi:hypothetical protein
MPKQISDSRKAAYYIGGAISLVGMLLFMSVFVTSALHFGDFANFEGRATSEMSRAIGGMILMMVGKFLQSIGQRGLAGAGVILDPEQAREDLQPYSRMAGGIINHALQETSLNPQVPLKTVIKIKCRDCDALNDEDARFCQKCGHQI